MDESNPGADASNAATNPGDAVTHAATNAVSPAGSGPRTPHAAEVIIGMFIICLLDWAAGLTIDYATVFDADTAHLLKVVDMVGQVVFWVVAIVAIIAAATGRPTRLIMRIFIAYLVVATIQLLINVFALVTSAGVRDDTVIWGLWDVAAVYVVIVAVFTGWYWMLDVITPGGAFVFPTKGGNFHPKAVDYVFIAFNTNATFGPTSESVVSRKAKVVMMLQTACSLLILLVFVARVVVFHSN